MHTCATTYLRKHNWAWYSDLVDKCANPYCQNEGALEVHHITPLCQGGKDTITNCIVLCFNCHRNMGLRLHTYWEPSRAMLLNWKAMVDNDVLNKMPDKYKREIANNKVMIDYGLMRLDSDIVSEKKNTIFNKMMKDRIIKTEHEKEESRFSYAYYCDHFNEDEA